MAFLTRRGARSVTTDLDRVANLFQHRHDDLGIPEEYATKFAYYCDVLSDRIEKHAIKLAEEAEKDEDKSEGEKKEAGCEKLPEGGMRDNCEAKKEEGGEKKEASRKRTSSKKAEDEKDEHEEKKASKKKADDETGLSVDHGASGFDANVIGDEVGGPLEILQPPSEPWMNDFFTQGLFQELNELQESGAMSNAAARGAIITKAAKASLARLRRLASGSRLSSIEDVLKVIHAKLSASNMAVVKALAPDVKKQIDAVGKVRDALIEQQAIGLVEPEVLSAADKIIQAISEQVPYLQQVVVGVDGGSPIALLEFQKLVGGGSLKDLIGLGASIVVDAAKSISKSETREAAAMVAGELPAFIKKKDEDKKDEDKKEASSSTKKAEDEKAEDEPEKKEASEEEEEGEEDAGDKTASDTFGYDLFSN